MTSEYSPSMYIYICAVLLYSTEIGDSYLIASDSHRRRAKQQCCPLVHDEVNICSLDDRVRAQHKLLPDMHDLFCTKKMQSERGAGYNDKRWQASGRIHGLEETTRTI